MVSGRRVSLQSSRLQPGRGRSGYHRRVLDTKARWLVQPVLDAIAATCHRAGIGANTLTIAGMLAGVGAAAIVAHGYAGWGIAVLWLSGLIDAADGTLARLTKPTPFGAILDITFDRVVELSVITALAWLHPEARFEMVILAGIIAIAMSLFLSIGAALQNASSKSFHYAPGLGERTEAFICLSLMILDQDHLVAWTWFFVALIAFTMAQRLAHVRRMLRPD